MTKQQATAVKDCLSNDEYSSDGEMLYHFKNEIGLNEIEANKAISLRTKYLVNPMYEGRI